MRTGALRNKIEVLVPSATVNSDGSHLGNATASLGTYWGKVSALTQDEKDPEDSQKVRSFVRYRITCRYDSDLVGLKPNTKVSINGGVAVAEVLSSTDKDGRGRFIEILAEERR